MRSAFVPLFCAIGLVVSGRIGTPAAGGPSEGNDELQGAWTIESSVTGGMEIPPGELKGFILTVEGDKHVLKKGDEVIQVGTQKLDPSTSPKAIDVTVTEGPNKGPVMLGIYELDGDTLTVCFDPRGKMRPTEFKSAPGSEHVVNVHKRVNHDHDRQ